MNRKFIKLDRKTHGFTLAEMMLVIFLVILLTATALTGIIRSQQSFIFNAADQQVQALVREARSLAVTGKAQPDYTDYDGDGCREAENHVGPCTMNNSDPADVDYVTPANYGIYFDKSTRTLTLFADIHQANGSTHQDGVFDVPTASGVYEANKDVIISSYTLPDTLDLIIDPDDGSDGYTVLYSPVFADVSFDEGLGSLPSLFFKYGIMENNGDRKRCMVIHPISGVPELLEKASSDTCS